MWFSQIMFEMAPCPPPPACNGLGYILCDQVGYREKSSFVLKSRNSQAPKDTDMNAISSIASSGMQAAQTVMRTSANNVANANTPGFQRQEVRQTAQAQGGVEATVKAADEKKASMEADVVAQLQAKNAFLANLQVFKTNDAMAGSLLSSKA
jgi:flagellar hook protein FlgE